MTDVPSPPPEEGTVEVTETAGVPAPATASGYPVMVSADHAPEYARFMPLIKWLLLIPHYIALFFLGIGAFFVWIASFFVVLFTAKYPEGMWNYMFGVQRWALRVISYSLLISDTYPPFTLEATPEDPVHLHAVRPETVSRWRPFFAWLIVIPYAIVASLIVYVAYICSFLAFFTIIFTKKIPEGLFNVIRIGLNWQYRANFYSYYMSTEYPPFEWDDEK